MTAAEIYATVIRPLPASERLELATRILNEIPPRAVVDYRDEWTEEDMRDAAEATRRHIADRLDAEEAETGG